MSKQVRFRGETLQAVKTDPSLRRSAVLHKHRSGNEPHVGAKQLAKMRERGLLPKEANG